MNRPISTLGFALAFGLVALVATWLGLGFLRTTGPDVPTGRQTSRGDEATVVEPEYPSADASRSAREVGELPAPGAPEELRAGEVTSVSAPRWRNAW